MPPLGHRADLQKRFEAKFTPEPNTGCWLWTGADDGTGRGYGRIRMAEGSRQAHHVALKIYTGQIVPSGMEVDHKCRMPCCVNPDHLEIVTREENMRRASKEGLKLGGNANGEKQKAKTHCPSGHPYSGPNLRIVPSTGARYCLICDRNKPSRNRLSFWKPKEAGG